VSRDVVLAVDGCNEEWADAVTRSERVDVGAVLEERLDRSRTALPGSEVQRGEAALRADQLVERIRARRAANTSVRGCRGIGRPWGAACTPGVLCITDRVLQRLFGRYHGREIDRLRRARRVSAVCQQLAHSIRTIERRGEHQRGLAVGGLRR